MVAVQKLGRLKKTIACLRIQNAALSMIINLRKIQIKKKRLRRWWVKPLLEPAVRGAFGGYARIISYLKDNDHEGFYKLFHMGPDNFDRIHDLVAPLIQKQVIRREPISTEIRLAATLLYLAKGGNVTFAATFFSIGVSTLYGILRETCHALRIVLSPLYLKFPSEPAHWLSIAYRFWIKWQNPNCLGALDGTHVWILRPPHGGTLFFNYKNFHSMILLIICDADCRILWFSLGDYGHLSDTSALAHSSLPRKLANGECNLPAPRALPGTDVVLPHFFVCDEIFALKENFMKPYSRRLGLSESQKAFNFRHSRGRMPSECTFGGVDKKWEILDSPLRFDLEVTKDVLVTIMCLHNYLITDANPELQDFGAGLPEDFDVEANPAYQPLAPNAIRDRLAQFFSRGGAGYLPWQDQYIH